MRVLPGNNNNSSSSFSTDQKHTEKKHHVTLVELIYARLIARTFLHSGFKKAKFTFNWILHKFSWSASGDQVTHPLAYNDFVLGSQNRHCHHYNFHRLRWLIELNSLGWTFFILKHTAVKLRLTEASALSASSFPLTVWPFSAACRRHRLRCRPLWSTKLFSTYVHFYSWPLPPFITNSNSNASSAPATTLVQCRWSGRSSSNNNIVIAPKKRL